MLLREQEYTRQACRDRVMGHLRESGDFPLMCLLCLQQLQLGVAVPLPIVDGDGADGRAHRIRDDVQGEQHEEGERVPLRERFAGSKASSKVTIEVTRPQIDHWVGVEYASVPMASGVSM